MKTTLAIVLVLATLAAFAYAEDDYKFENDVLILTDKNFKGALDKYPFILVKFYAPWCGHCKALAPHFEKAAGRLQKTEPKVMLGHVDCTVEKDTCQQFSVQGYPTVKFFTNGQPVDYQGPRTEDGIVSWCSKKTGPSSVEITTKEGMDKLIADNKVAVVFFGEKGSSYETFDKFTKTFDDAVFAHTFDAGLKTEFGISNNNVVLFKQFDDKRNDCNCEINTENLKNFIESNYLPLIMDFDQKTAQKIFGEQKPCLFLLVDKEAKSKAAASVLVEVAQKLKGKILICQTEIADGLGKRLGDYIGVKDNLPQFKIVNPANGMKKYPLTEEITTENVLKFYDDYSSGKLTPVFKSQDIPATNDKPVKTVVGKNFNQIVLDSTKDVLVKFYAPWCGHCKSFAPIYEKFAEKIQAENPNIILADVDATENEVEGVEIQGFPTIKFWPANNKKTPIDFKDERTEDGLVKFFKEKNTVGFVFKGQTAEEQAKDQTKEVPGSIEEEIKEDL